MRVEFTIHGPVPSAANLREHHMARARRAKAQRTAARWYALSWLTGLGPLDQAQARDMGEQIRKRGATITLTRVGPRKLDDDNLASACKAYRDGIADALGIDDGDSRLTWVYGQERGVPHGLRVTIEPKGGSE